jgi:alpha-1,2-mannosyltransferase
MASRAGGLPMGPVRASTAAPWRRRPLALEPPMLWIMAVASTALLAIYSLRYSADDPEMDFQVYRMGGQRIFGPGLYSSQIDVLGRHLSFTYPPFAALLFWPTSHLSVFAGQVLWDAINLAALVALIAVSVAAARSRLLVSSDWRTGLMLLLPAALLLYPVRSDLALGQINIVLMLMIVADLTIGLSWRSHSLPSGVLVGLAAAVKLTPLVFIPFLVGSRQWHAARNATLTFVLTTVALFAVSPHASWVYFTKDAFDLKRVGNSLTIGNQALHAAIIRAHVSPSSLLFDLVAAGVLCGGVAIAVVAYRRSSKLLAVLICAATALLLSPISWLHHYVWIVPAVIWLATGRDRPAKGPYWAFVAALTFVVVPPAAGRSGPLWFVRDDAYVIASVIFIGLIGAMLWFRRDAPSNPCPRRTTASDPIEILLRRGQDTWVEDGPVGYATTWAVAPARPLDNAGLQGASAIRTSDFLTCGGFVRLTLPAEGKAMPDEVSMPDRGTPDVDGTGGTTPTRVSRAWIGIIAGALVLVLLLIFILQNTRPVKVSYFTLTGTMPLGVALLLAAISGLLLAAGVASMRIWQLRRRMNKRHNPPPGAAEPNLSDVAEAR